jgi:hypothetical protein
MGKNVTQDTFFLQGMWAARKAIKSIAKALHTPHRGPRIEVDDRDLRLPIMPSGSTLTFCGSQWEAGEIGCP